LEVKKSHRTGILAVVYPSRSLVDIDYANPATFTHHKDNS